jgi:hypothetical protein
MTGASPSSHVASGDGAAAGGDGAAAGLAIGAVLGWLATGVTRSLVVAVLTVALMAALTGTATYTAIAGTRASVGMRILASVAAAAAAAVFVLRVDHIWAWGIPALALLAGIGHARSLRLRVIASATASLLVVAAVWIDVP